MARKTKDRIANEMYGDEFEYLEAGEKAAVTRAFNAQGSAPRTPRASSRVGTVTAKIGRLGQNGSKECILHQGATINDLLNQSGYVLDTRKEAVNAQSTGLPVDLDSRVVQGEMYVITTEIKSA